MTDTQPQPLRAVPDDTDATLKPVAPPAATPAHEPLRPVLPDWLRSRENLRAAARRRARYELHRTAYHGTRSPAYLAKTLFWGITGTGWLFLLWLHWWLSPVPASVHQQATAEGWRSWKTLIQFHMKISKTRGLISLFVAVAVAVLGDKAWTHHAHWALPLAAVALVVTAAAVARPEGVRIVTPHVVPAALEKLTQDVVVRALGSLGISGIDRWLREGKPADQFFPHPIRQDGPGWRAEIDLPHGVTATQVIERREQLASGLRRPLGAVWPEPVTSEHAGRLELWVGQQDISKAKPSPWPLLKTGQADIFKGLPFATDVRGRRVNVPIAYHNWLIGSIPRQGKTVAVRILACGIALDPMAEEWVHELKGTGDLDPLEEISHRFVSGIDDESIAYTAESLAALRYECEKRGPRIKALPASICPEKRVTRQIADKYPKLRPVVCIIDECQNLFAHPKYGKQAGADAEFVIKIGPAMGIWLILATQRPDKDSLPTGVSGNVSIRFCLKVMGQIENDMILGTSAYKNGIRATTFRPVVDAGTGYLISDAPAPQVCKTDPLLTIEQVNSVVARAKVLRERAGTLPAAAAAGEPERDVLADVLAAMGNDPGLHWEVLAERLAERFPDRWAGASGDAVSAQCRALGVPSAQVKVGGVNRQGCRRADVEQMAAASPSRPLIPTAQVRG